MARFASFAMVCAISVIALRAASPGAASGKRESDHDPVIIPGAEGLIDLSIGDPSGEADGLANPFRFRYHPRLQPRDVPIKIGLVLVGAASRNDSAVINDAPYQVGDRFEGLTIASISSETVELRGSRFVVRLPINDGVLTLRLAK